MKKRFFVVVECKDRIKSRSSMILHLQCIKILK